MKTGTSIAALAAILLASTASSAADIPGWCQYALSDAPRTAPKFETYAVKVERIAHAPRVDLASDRRAPLYRTNLRNAAKETPNFAGHYRLASWGCGTGCLNWMLVDLKTGRVASDSTMFTLQNARVAFDHEKDDDAYASARHATYEFGVLLYRPDSALLVTLGQPNEDDARDGMAYCRWTGAAFEKLAFYPAIKLCKKPKD